jgi:hypothetical protein
VELILYLRVIPPYDSGEGEQCQPKTRRSRLPSQLPRETCDQGRIQVSGEVSRYLTTLLPRCFRREGRKARRASKNGPTRYMINGLRLHALRFGYNRRE